MPLAAIIANRWFAERRGVVTGILTASYATGQLVFLPIVAWIAREYGWRSAAGVVATVAFVVVLPLVLVFLRSHPSDVGLPAYGASEIEHHAKPAGSVSAALGGFRMAARTQAFWILAATFFVCGASTNGLIGTHLIPAAHDHGMSEVTGAGLLATIGVFDIIGTLASGWLTDRYDSRWLLFWYYGLRGLSLLALPYVFEAKSVGLIAFIVFYGLDWVATVPPTVRLVADHFGRENVGIIFAWVFSAHQFGAAVAAYGAGAIRDASGDYQIAFLSSGLLCLVASGLVIRMANEPGSRVRSNPQLATS